MNEGESVESFKSKIHSREIDSQHWQDFLVTETANTIADIRKHPQVLRYKETLELVAQGIDIWATEGVDPKHRSIIKHDFSAQSATQQNNERLVKRATYVRATGKNERNDNLYCIAANGFFSEIMTTEKNKSAEKKQRGVRRGPEKASAFVRTVGEKLVKLTNISTEMGHQAFRSLRCQIKKNLTTEEHSYVGQRKEKS